MLFPAGHPASSGLTLICWWLVPPERVAKLAKSRFLVVNLAGRAGGSNAGKQILPKMRFKTACMSLTR